MHKKSAEAPVAGQFHQLLSVDEDMDDICHKEDKDVAEDSLLI